MTKCVGAKTRIFLEFTVFLINFSEAFYDSVKINFVIFRSCHVSLGYNKSDCALLGTKHTDTYTADLEQIVEPHAAVINMVGALMTSCIGALICLIIGPWSDRFGRKPILITSAIAYATFYFLLAIVASVDDLSPWYVVLAAVPVSLGGGKACYFVVLNCYVADVTTNANRGMKMALIEATLVIGVLTGTVSSPYMFAATGYVTIFIISGLCCCLNIFLVVFFVPESLKNPKPKDNLRALVQSINVTEMLQVVFRKRQNSSRYTVLSCLLICSLMVVTINGERAVLFLFLREKFQWSLEKFSIFIGTQCIIVTVSTVFGIYVLHKVMKYPETTLVLFGCGAKLCGTLQMGVATNDREIYFGAGLWSLGGVISSMMRSLVSKIVPEEDVGKVFAAIAASESLFGISGSPLYTTVYNATIGKNSAIFNFVSSGIYFVEMWLILGIIIERKRDNNYRELVNEGHVS